VADAFVLVGEPQGGGGRGVRFDGGAEGQGEDGGEGHEAVPLLVGWRRAQPQPVPLRRVALP